MCSVLVWWGEANREVWWRWRARGYHCAVVGVCVS